MTDFSDIKKFAAGQNNASLMRNMSGLSAGQNAAEQAGNKLKECRTELGTEKQRFAMLQKNSQVRNMRACWSRSEPLRHEGDAHIDLMNTRSVL